jgi:hypothetical protein
MSESQTCSRTTYRTREKGQKARHAREQQTGREKRSESQICSRTIDRTREKVRKPDMHEDNRQDERECQKARHV